MVAARDLAGPARRRYIMYMYSPQFCRAALHVVVMVALVVTLPTRIEASGASTSISTKTAAATLGRCPQTRTPFAYTHTQTSTFTRRTQHACVRVFIVIHSHPIYHRRRSTNHGSLPTQHGSHLTAITAKLVPHACPIIHPHSQSVPSHHGRDDCIL